MSDIPNDLPESFWLSYAIQKKIPSAYAIATNYGAIELDPDLRAAVERAVRPILERRLKRARRQEQEQEAAR